MTSRKGTYYAPWPLDFRLLALLPEEGTIGGVHWKGRRVKDLVVELNKIDGIDVTTEMVVARIRSMHVAGYVKDFPASKSKVWAKTPKGVRLQKKEDQHGA